MASHVELREWILTELKNIIIQSLRDEDVRIYLFGSWARNEEKQSSDIDIAIEADEVLSPLVWFEMRDKIEESTIPYHVDIVDMKNVNEQLIENVKKEGILWKNYKND